MIDACRHQQHEHARQQIIQWLKKIDGITIIGQDFSSAMRTPRFRLPPG